MTTAHDITDKSNASDAALTHALAERFVAAYENRDGLLPASLEAMYTEDVCFEDPAHAIQGRTEFLRYFNQLIADLGDCRFKFHRVICQDNDIFLAWTLFFTHRNLAGGEVIRVEGATLAKTRGGRIYFHRDYFDLGAMLYEHVPLLGPVVSHFKRKLGKR